MASTIIAVWIVPEATASYGGSSPCRPWAGVFVAAGGPSDWPCYIHKDIAILPEETHFIFHKTRAKVDVSFQHLTYHIPHPGLEMNLYFVRQKSSRK